MKIFLFRIKVWCDGDRFLRSVVIAETKEQAIELLVEEKGESSRSLYIEGECAIMGDALPNWSANVFSTETC